MTPNNGRMLEIGEDNMKEMIKEAKGCRHAVSYTKYGPMRFFLFDYRKSFPCKKCGKAVKTSKPIRILTVILCVISRASILVMPFMISLLFPKFRMVALFGVGACVAILLEVLRIIILSKCIWSE